MDQRELIRTAEELDRQLRALVEDDEVNLFRSAVHSLLAAALAGSINRNMEWRDVPGAYFFNEGGLRKHPALEEAFAAFRFALTGGTP